ncbi:MULTISPECIES: hypothetical protein [unclassified Bacillus (in: firmicutes)]|uniref:hypothetical protein n=1 Tax=unclassified Bacillus (in: firmicutes) TaxID=185979 RepID=UPI0008E40733|nr:MULTISPECIES: hypothetical protein [unclassified Bacillus (in: firmicutes)]SFB20460.1 hypothetical protein SAMN02799634_10898 [Bacillus sp. UNCCL13]SFQ90874.1 hypothetical protein SAMN04488577_3913 [Bacillus sp. cl95]
MTVNHGGALSKEYFLAYLNLIIISRQFSLEQAQSLTMELFFRHNPDMYGKDTYKSFLEAGKELTK